MIDGANTEWSETAPWPVRVGRVVLEASAGTGKTYQLSALVVRLVAERGIGVDRILVMTFTDAAARELKDRIRRRLRDEVAALEGGESTWAARPLARYLARLGDPTVDEVRRRLTIALADFDRAPISTIHGFCQRTLTEFAVEAGQDLDLEVIADDAELRGQEVADAIANAGARATTAEAARLADLGWHAETLSSIAKAMGGVDAPDVAPLAGDLRSRLAAGEPAWQIAVDAARRVEAAVLEFACWWHGGDGRAVEAAWRDALAGRLGSAFPARLDWVEPQLEGLSPWLAAGARRGQRPGIGKKAWLVEATYADNSKVRGLEWWPTWPGRRLLQRFARLCEAQDDGQAAALGAFALTIRARTDAQLRARGLITYDAMVGRLAACLRAEAALPNGRGPLHDALLARFDAGLVDEFQDTDGAQWAILDRTFPSDSHLLFLIGDPKQAIYGFRGADIDSYHQATGAGAAVRTLSNNFRADGPLIAALNHLWMRGTPFGAQGPITYREVTAFHAAARIALPGPADGRQARPLQLRMFDGCAGGGSDPTLSAGRARALAAALAAQEVAQLIAGGAHLFGERGVRQPVSPGHVAVLVRTHRQAGAALAALRRLGIPAVSKARESVFTTPAAAWILSWLDALAAPNDGAAARAFALSPLGGMAVADVARALGDADRGEPALRFERLANGIAAAADRFGSRGFVRSFDQMVGECGALTRILGRADGERSATDLRHLAELLHREDRRRRATPFGLAEWLRARAADDVGSSEDDESIRRLESDADAVQVTTIHASKGLQYPVVLLPYLWDDSPSDTGAVAAPRSGLPVAGFPGTASRVVMVAPTDHPLTETARAARTSAGDAERMRLLYVAMTRAEHRLVGWLCRLEKPRDLGRAARLIAPHAHGPAKQVAAAMAAELSALDAAGAQGIAADLQCAIDREPAVMPEPDAAAALEPPTCGRAEIAGGWHIVSYSGLARSIHVDSGDDGSAAEENNRGGADEGTPTLDGGDGTGGDDPMRAAADRDSAAADAMPIVPEALRIAAPGADLPRGVEFGTFLHQVFEHLEFAGEPGAPLVAKDGQSGVDLVLALSHRTGVGRHVEAQAVCAVAANCLDTPLGVPGPAGPTGAPTEFTLRGLAQADRIDELRFDLAIGAGARFDLADSQRSGARIEPAAIAAALAPAASATAAGARFGCDASTWLWHYLGAHKDGEERRERQFFGAIAGMLNGSIDLLFRVPVDAGQRGDPGAYRYYLADYKSNAIKGPEALRRATAALAGPDRHAPLWNAHYTRAAMRHEMGVHAYHLQALLYSVALHRLLRLRLGARYDPQRHLGGHLYLFVRGMAGPATAIDGSSNTPIGVYADRWPAAVIGGLDLALTGASADAVARAMEAA